jgi:polyhydroxybutyrate depolymerase
MRYLPLLMMMAACSPSETPMHVPGPLVAARPYDSNIPKSYDASKPTPLVVLLHGYSAGAFIQDKVFGGTELSEAKGFLYAFPSGTTNSLKKQFWNATDACCDRDGSGVDDVAYLNAVIDDMKEQYNVDDKRIYFMGHSNGGFMSHRMACEPNSRIAAIASLAGATWKDPSKCNPNQPVAVLEVHGTLDSDVPFDGEPLVPSAHETVATWAQKNGCPSPITMGAQVRDLDEVVSGFESSVERYFGCARGSVELWVMKDSGHVPVLKLPDWGNALWEFFTANPRP